MMTIEPFVGCGGMTLGLRAAGFALAAAAGGSWPSWSRPWSGSRSGSWP